MNKRLFIAINLPESERAKIFDLVQKLAKKNKNKPIKCVERDNVHLTLHFLGSVAEEKVQDINSAIEPVISQYSQLEYHIGGSIDAFPDMHNPRVVFLNLKEHNGNKTMELRRAIGKALESIGFEIDPRPFRMHVTIARIKAKTSIVLDALEYEDGVFTVDSVDLMESELTSDGPLYTIIKKIKLNV